MKTYFGTGGSTRTMKEISDGTGRCQNCGGYCRGDCQKSEAKIAVTTVVRHPVLEAGDKVAELLEAVKNEPSMAGDVNLQNAATAFATAYHDVLAGLKGYKWD